jgi:hypothetical protein
MPSDCARMTALSEILRHLGAQARHFAAGSPKRASPVGGKKYYGALPMLRSPRMPFLDRGLQINFHVTKIYWSNLFGP